VEAAYVLLLKINSDVEETRIYKRGGEGRKPSGTSPPQARLQRFLRT
jgi:hypothetical protein